MKVTFATHGAQQRLGIAKYFCLLANQLRRQDVDVAIVIDTPEGKPVVDELCPGAEVHVVGPAAIDPGTTLRFAWNVAKFLDKSDTDIVHAGHVIPFFYLMTGNKPVLFQPFGNELFTLSGKGMNPLYCAMARPILKYCAEHADVLAAEGDFQVPDMKRWYPAAQQIRILPVGVDTTRTRRKTDYSVGDHFEFLVVNSLHPWERIDTIIKALPLVLQEYPGARVCIVGWGPEEDRLKGMARDLPVTFLKNISEETLYNLYRMSDAFVCTTAETDMQMGVLEAMASGLPVISVQREWLPSAGITYNDNSSYPEMHLASAMLTMARYSPQTRAKIGWSHIEYTRSFEFPAVARKALEIYREMLGQ